MKKTVILCIVSAGFGAALSAFLVNPPDFSSRTVAQEPRLAQLPGQARSSRPGATVPNPLPDTLGPVADELTPEERVNVAVYEQVNRSVVHINTQSVVTEGFFFLEVVPTRGEGSGVVIDKQGHVLTNFHVVEEAREIRVTLFDGNSYEAEIIGGDPPNDLAVLQIDAPSESLVPVVFGDSTRLRVGQWAYAIGNPFGLERTLSVGVISSLNRPLETRRIKFKQLIQIDADINPGNSGGPLLDSRGRMIGLNTVIASSTGQSAGVGFAIPVNTISRIVPELIEHGRVVRGDIGIHAVYQTGQGLQIAELTPRGAAERAGLKGPQVVVERRARGGYVYERQYIDRSAADLIVGLDGEPARTVDDFRSVIESKKPGDKVTLNVIRDGRRVDVPVTLDADE